MNRDVDVRVAMPFGRDGPQPAVPVVSVCGEVDLKSAPDLTSALHDELARGSGTVVVELSDVTFFGARGLASLVDARDLAMANGQELVLGGCSPAVQRVLDLTGTRSLFAFS